MSSYCYDLEVFPNFLSATFMNIADKSVKQFVISDQRDDRKELARFINQADRLVGFNSLSYDDAILIVFLRSIREKNLNQILFELSGRLIAEGNIWDEAIREVRWASRSWQSLDLLKLMAFDKRGVGLKQVAIILGWPIIQDLPLPYDELVDLFDYSLVLEYNLNDVRITHLLYEKTADIRKLREEINQIYHVDVSNASKSKMANILLEKFYSEATKTRPKDLRVLKTVRTNVNLKDCIPDDVSFRHTVLADFLSDLRDKKVTSEARFKFDQELYFSSKKYQVGVGGLHSVDEPAKFIANSEYRIFDVDVASYYPSLMHNLRIKPEHLTDKFLDILDMIRAERLAAKHSGQKAKADALKITINSIFGKLGSDKFWLYDPKAFLQVTIAGQLYLLVLIERITDSGIEILSANTDGITVRVHKDNMERFAYECDLWQADFNLELEQTEYKKYIRRDVNNYIAQKVDESTKENGIFDTDLDLEKMNNSPIIARALKEYFINGIAIEETIGSCQNILDFCLSQKVGPVFQMEYHTRKGIEALQKTNRFYASNLGGTLWKRHREKNTLTGLLVGQNTRILNRYKEAEITTFDVDYPYYIGKCYEVIDLLEPKFVQLSFI